MMKDDVVERRSLRRYALRVPIHIEHIGIGTTRDVSPDGVAFEIDAALATGSQIRFTMNFSGHALRAVCVGRVVRVDRSGERAVGAARIESIDHVAFGE